MSSSSVWVVFLISSSGTTLLRLFDCFLIGYFLMVSFAFFLVTVSGGVGLGLSFGWEIATLFLAVGLSLFFLLLDCCLLNMGVSGNNFCVSLICSAKLVIFSFSGYTYSSFSAENLKSWVNCRGSGGWSHSSSMSGSWFGNVYKF